MKIESFHQIVRIAILLPAVLSLAARATAQSGPSITSLSPSVGPVSPVGGPISIKGSGFGTAQGGSSTVTVGGLAVTPISWTATKIVVPAIASLPVGFNDAVVTVGGVASNAQSFLVIPVITSVSPANGIVGSSVTVTGTSFGDQQGTSAIAFNGIVATPTQWSNTSVTAPVSNTSGLVSIVITVNGFATNSAQFPVVPGISSLQPSSALPGAAVTIAGVGFGNAPGTAGQVTIGGVAATIQNWSANSITALVPLNASGGNLMVTAGDGKTSSPVSFTVLQPNPVTVTPASAVVGSVISITGASFGTEQADSTLTLGGLPLQVVSWADGEVRAAVPSGATSGEVLATVQGVVYGAPLSIISVPANAIVNSFQYDARGQLISATDPLNHTTSLTYTNAGLVQTVTDALGNVTQFQYDAAGNRTSSTDALQNITLLTYDTMNRLTAVTFADGSTNQFAYDIRGRKTSSTDGNGKVTSFAYDDADRMTSVTDASGGQTQYSYDGENNLAAITDALQRHTAFAYDDLRRLTLTTFPSGFTESYAYDANGNLSGKTDRNGNAITYSYDSLDRLIAKHFPNGTGVAYSYDVVNRLTQVTDSTGTYGFSYDNLGRMTGSSTKYNSIPGRTFTMAWAYDNAGNRIAYTDAQGGQTAYTHDALNRITGIQDAKTSVFGLSYDALGRRTGLTRPNGVNTSYSYDAVSNLLSVVHKNGPNTLDGATYAYDLAGNRVNKNDLLSGNSSAYGYDALYQLTGVTQGANSLESYSYDAVGNRLSSQTVSSYAYNASNELTSAGSTTFTYDNNGNTLTKTDVNGVTHYNWDFENRLISVTMPDGSPVSSRYDPFGRRIQKGSSVFLYDGNALVGEVDNGGNPAAEYSLSGSIDEPLAAYRGNALTYYEADGIGSITSLSTAAGTLGDSFVYDSFGKVISSPAAFLQPFRFTGREFDVETELYFYRARYYDFSTGRFLSEDPLRAGGGLNFYAYVRDNPIMLADPFGLKPGDKYPTMDCAGYHAVGDVNFLSQLIGLEMGGRLYQNPDGTYSYTEPVTGSPTSVFIDAGARQLMEPNIPAGTYLAGSYHTHPSWQGIPYVKIYPEGFSEIDRVMAMRDFTRPRSSLRGDSPASYLGTPLDNIFGSVHKYVTNLSGIDKYDFDAVVYGITDSNTTILGPPRCGCH